MRKILILLLLGSFATSAFSQSEHAYTPSASNLQAREWFQDARFGMFIHWGASSVLCNGEWVMETQGIDFKNYKRVGEFFYPSQFDPKAWVTAAKNAGMKYITFTSRHHDGFSNWDTKQSDWKVTNTPYGKDVLKMLAAECQKQDIKLVLYYSTLDWSRNDYQWETGRSGQRAGRTEKSNWPSYINFMKAQLTELLTDYGPIAGFWFDGHWDQTADNNRTTHETAVDWHYPEIYALIHKLQPACLIGNNHHLPPIAGEDFQMFERDLPGENKHGYSGQAVGKLPLEMCQTIGGSWGYSIKDTTYKSSQQIIELLVKSAGSNANLLLNVGPMPNGLIQPEHFVCLANVGKWTSLYGETIYGTTNYSANPAWGAITQKATNKICYVHIFDTSQPIVMDLPKKPQQVKWLTSDTKPEWKYDTKSKQLTVHLKNEEHKMSHPIIEVRY